MEDDEIRALVKRLARPDRAGGHTVERAAIMASGGDAQAILTWLGQHAAEPEALKPKRETGGLHGDRAGGAARAVQRFVLPPGTLG